MKRMLERPVRRRPRRCVGGRRNGVGKAERNHGHKGHKTITVIEHATTDTTTDTGAAGDSAGDS